MITQENIPYTADEIKAMVKTCEKYNKALERAKYALTTDMDNSGHWAVNYIFPEFKESEDEKIRKELIDAIQGLWDNDALPMPLSVKRKDSWIAWLEKQGEKPQGKSALESIKEEKVDNQNCVKSADKVEPKFKVGDWITDGYIYYKITEILDDRYIIESKYDKRSAILFEYENRYHLWSINDAKDGDVLADDSCIFIIQKLGDNNTAKIYCILYDDGDFNYDSILYLHFHIDSTKPATKEQRDLLFQKMKEAGYEWNAEKKQVKKIKRNENLIMNYEEKYKNALERARDLMINQNPPAFDKHLIGTVFPELAESEDERIRKVLLNDFKNSCSEYYCEGVNRDMIIAWLEKQGKRDARYEYLEELLEADTEYQMAMNDAMVEEAKTKAIEAISNLYIFELLGLEKQGEPTRTNIEIPFGESDSELQEVSYSIPEGFYAEIKDDRVVIKKAKFKVGDWITTTDEEGNVTTEKIIEFWGDKVRLIDTNGFYSLWPKHELNYYHIWTINDANDGDVLVNSKGQPFIFSGKYDDIHFDSPIAYCGVNCQNKFKIGNGTHWTSKNGVSPATKEQRDLLFSKIKQAGYEWRQDEKKLIKINESKFKVGDYIVPDNITSLEIWRVINIDEDGYYNIHSVTNPEDDETYRVPAFILEKDYRLWTINDAKDGDVIATSAGAFIYNGNNGGGGCPGSYCGINTLGRFQTGTESHWTSKKVYPATKEQRNLLFQKMAEEGYVWVSEKKELIKN